MEFMDIIHARRSTRAYTSEQISEEELSAIVEAGRTAPIAGADFSMSHMTVVQSPELVAEIRAACQMTRKDGTKVDPTYGAPTLIFMSATINFPLLVHNSLFLKSSKKGCAIISIAVSLFCGLYKNILFNKSIKSLGHFVKILSNFFGFIFLVDWAIS